MIAKMITLLLHMNFKKLGDKPGLPRLRNIGENYNVSDVNILFSQSYTKGILMHEILFEGLKGFASGF